MTRYPKMEDYGGITFDTDSILRFACCDCAAIHDFAFEIEKDKITVVMRRGPRATAQLRRHNYGNLQQNLKENKYRMERV